MLEQAADLFARRGFNGATLQEVAQAMGISRAALYHYIDSKDALLIELVEGLTRETLDQVIAISKSDAPASEKLYGAIARTAETVASKAARWRLLELSESALPPALAGEHQVNRQQTLEVMTRILHDAVTAGAARPVDEEVAAYGILGACNWIAWWCKSRPDLRPSELGAIMAKVITTGLLFGGEAPRTTDDAITAIRENVDFLERQIKGG
jgi:AcrR family transcriptional regulator